MTNEATPPIPERPLLRGERVWLRPLEERDMPAYVAGINDTEVGGLPISEGEHVMALLGSANVDDAEFRCAGDVQWDREENRHLAFGGGLHRCLGSHLARLELTVALEEFHRRVPEYELVPGTAISFSPGIRQAENLHLRFPVES